MKIVYSYRNIAWIYEIKQNCDSATWYAKTGISLLKGDSLSPVFSSLLHFMGEQEKKRKNYSEGNYLSFCSAVKNERIPHLAYCYCMSLGDTYLQLGQLEKAEKYLKKVLASKDDYTQSGAYNYLYLLEKKAY